MGHYIVLKRAAEWQYSIFKQTISSYKCCFFLGIFSKVYLVVATC